MDRVTVYSYDDEIGGRTLAGYFDRDAAKAIEENTRWDGNNNVSVHTRDQWEHQMLYRTAQGRWVLHGWSQRQGSADSFEFVDDERARDWLIVNGDEDIITRHFGEIPAERGPGRPPIGPAVTVRFPFDVLEVLDATAEAEDLTRPEFIRRRMALSLGMPADE